MTTKDVAEELSVSQDNERTLIADVQLAAIGGRIVTRAALTSCIRRRDRDELVQPDLDDPCA